MPNKGTVIASLMIVSGISIFLYGFFFGWYQCLSGCLSDPTYVPIYGILIVLMGVLILFRINTPTRIALGSIAIAFLSTVSSAYISSSSLMGRKGPGTTAIHFPFTRLFAEGLPLLQTTECTCS
ncbi:MAG: hypothetical protein ACHQ1H_10105 [Nitrososphaerales archaeon]